MEEAVSSRIRRATEARGPFDFDEESLLRDLLFLRKYGGFKPSRMGSAAELRHALGGTHLPFETLRERFESAIRSLRDPEPQLLCDVYGLSPETERLDGLKARRAHHGRRIGRGVETVANLEEPAIEHLRTQLVTGWYPLSPLGIRLPESHNGVVQESVAIVTTVKDGQWCGTYEQYRLLAAFEEAEFLTVSSSWPGRPVPMGDFTVRTKKINDSFSHQFWHKTPMRRGQFYDLRFRVTPDTDYDEPGWITETSRAFHEPTRRASFRVVFEGVRPKRVWRFERLTIFERPVLRPLSNYLRPTRRSQRPHFMSCTGDCITGLHGSGEPAFLA